MNTDTESKTTRVMRNGQVTIPNELREEYGIEEGNELRWESDEDGIIVRKVPRSAGRGMLVDDVSADTREALAEEMEAEIRENRRTEWTPD